MMKGVSCLRLFARTLSLSGTCCGIFVVSYSLLLLYFHDCLFFSVLRDQWVIAKYQRKEFCAGAEKPAYMSGGKHLACLERLLYPIRSITFMCQLAESYQCIRMPWSFNCWSVGRN